MTVEYDEDEVNGDGSGTPYNEVTNAIRNRAVTEVAVFGHSHGGGATRDIVQRLDDNRSSIGAFTISATVYVDAIENGGMDNDSETNLPPSTLYHANYYETNTTALCGAVVPGANINLNVNGTSWGAALTHTTIDDNTNVINRVIDQITNNLNK